MAVGADKDTVYLFKVDSNDSFTSLGVIAKPIGGIKYFGSVLAIDKNILVVGSTDWYSDRVYLYEKSPDDSITKIEELTAVNGRYAFASSMAINSNMIATSSWGCYNDSPEHGTLGYLHIFDMYAKDNLYLYEENPLVLYYNENSTGKIYSISAGSPSGIKSYTLSGDDSEQFRLNENNITLDTALDYEAPSDTDGNGVYELNILIEDGKGREKSLGVEVNVVDRWE